MSSYQLFGERLEDGYVKHPPAYTADRAGTDGWPLDAATVQILASNAAHLAAEGPRNFAQTLGPGRLAHYPDVLASTVPAGSNPYAPVWWDTGTPADSYQLPWTTLPGVTLPPGLLESEHSWRSIPWDRRSARCIGITHGIEDRPDDAAITRYEPRQRTVQFVVDLVCKQNVDLVRRADLFFAATTSVAAASIDASTPLINVSSLVGAGIDVTLGRQRVARQLKVPTPLPVGASPLRARKSALAGGTIRVAPLYLWIGWLFVAGTDAEVALLSFSAFEVR